MNILKLAAMLTLDGSRFKSGLREAQVASNRFGNDVAKDIKNKLAGAFGFAALAYGIKRIIDLNSEIKDTADSLDISTKALQEQQFWVTQNGGSISDLTAAYRGLAKARMAALEGDEGKLGIFDALGINQAELASGKMENLFAKAAEGFRNNDFGADRIAAVMEIFGKGGTAILPALSQSLDEAASKAHELGQVIDEGVNSRLEEMGDILDQLAGKGKNIASAGLLGLIQGIDMGITTLGQGVLGLGQQVIRVVNTILGAVGKIPGMGGLPGLRGWLSAQDAALGDASNTMFESMLDRYDPAKLEKRNRGGRGAGLFSDEEPESRATSERAKAMERLAFDKINLPNPAASEVSGLTRSGQLSGRSFAYSNKEAERELEIARQTLQVERDQLRKLEEIAREKGKTLRVNP